MVRWMGSLVIMFTMSMRRDVVVVEFDGSLVASLCIHGESYMGIKVTIPEEWCPCPEEYP
jgi:hypothetical protein